MEALFPAALLGRWGEGRGCFHDVTGGARRTGGGAVPEGTRGQEPQAKPGLSPRAGLKQLGQGRAGHAVPRAGRGEARS